MPLSTHSNENRYGEGGYIILTYICTPCGHSYGLHIPGVAPASGNVDLRWHLILFLLLFP